MERITLHDGRITLINGDCLDVLPKIKPNCIDLIVADPPYYGVVKDKWDNVSSNMQEHINWSKQWLVPAIATLKDSASLYVWGGIGEKSDNIIHVKLLLDTLNMHFKDLITWQKDRGMGHRRGWLYAREECLWYVKDNKQFIWNELHQYGTERRKRDKGLPEGKTRLGLNGATFKSEFKRLTSVWSDISELGSDVLNKQTPHVTPKPLKAIERIVNAHITDQDQVILDPFLGSGTTGQVCAKLGLRFIGIEKDTTAFEDAVKHIKASLMEYQNVNA